ncbi:DinB family protein [Sporosarcina gallistercoris]|uniref:DinB family protein n=1 Tax=Sporosarcina gallistercoris TaxID=2762245 RepID=A0ABR8PK93_9BACL|nr:DinB family protein [Sporosarcina gallistercoris]MBD7908598.1 DinB family protein [Sporosarcina gallistercoris]
MSYSTVLPLWEALRQRFTHTTSALPESDLNLTLGKSSIRALLYHTAEVEYMFAEWFFGKTKPEYPAQTSSDSIQQLVELLAASNAHFVAAMKELPEEDWRAPIESPMGVSSPLEAVGRLMYHTGMHAGQISLIQQNGSCE